MLNNPNKKHIFYLSKHNFHTHHLYLQHLINSHTRTYSVTTKIVQVSVDSRLSNYALFYVLNFFLFCFLYFLFCVNTLTNIIHLYFIVHNYPINSSSYKTKKLPSLIGPRVYYSCLVFVYFLVVFLAAAAFFALGAASSSFALACFLPAFSLAISSSSSTICDS